MTDDSDVTNARSSRAPDAPSPDDVEQARERARRWLDAEPDDDIRTELADLLAGDDLALVARMSGRLEFGTAGLRAPVGAGPLRMNRLVVRQAAAGLGAYLIATQPDAVERGVVIGFDARRKSEILALDSARVFAAMGIRVRLFDRQVPTPLVPFSVLRVAAAAGVVVTASHNPPADNGYKVYLGTGAQIVPPQDTEISAHIEANDPVSVALAPIDDPLIELVGDDLIDAYIDHAASVRRRPEIAGVRVAYTALHGVGGSILERAFAQAGLPAPVTVEAQHTPDGTFPTVSFPNPEEPGAIDLVIATARAAGVTVALANDPDADRLGVAIEEPDGQWRRLSGDEVGWLLADYLIQCALEDGDGSDRLVVTTLVSSSLLGRMAAAAGIESVETFTGFKWIAQAVLDRPQRRLLFAYEQALGYLVSPAPLDKDGVTAAIVFAEIAAVAASAGHSIADRLDDIAARFGHHRIADASIRLDAAASAARIDAIRQDPPGQLGDRRVVDVSYFSAANLLRFDLVDDIRVQVRPSGTEPKVKIYAEGVDVDPSPYVAALVELLAEPELTP